MKKDKNRVYIFDTTLRDGEQSPGCSMNTEENFHAKGFEIAGIDLDEDKDSLTNFVAAQKVEWPQFFDGKALETKYAADFGLKERDIPALWLVDKKGVLRYINAGFDFDKKLERLLGE